MAVSQNGWAAQASSSGLASLEWITGRVMPGDVYTIFDYFCRRFHQSVEPIRRDHSWGWAYRDVRGASVLSNHASATAIDLNAPAHPLGRSGTFSPGQMRALRALLDSLDGAVRWGGDYSGRKDEMHFEINAPRALVAAVAAKIRGSATGGSGAGSGASHDQPAPPTYPAPAVPKPPVAVKVQEDDEMFRIRVAEKTNGAANASAGTIYLCRFGNAQEAAFRALSPAENEAVDRAGIEIKRIGGRDYSENEKNLMRAAILGVRDTWGVK